jgi:hypothetical protein
MIVKQRVVIRNFDKTFESKIINLVVMCQYEH